MSNMYHAKQREIFTFSSVQRVRLVSTTLCSFEPFVSNGSDEKRGLIKAGSLADRGDSS